MAYEYDSWGKLESITGTYASTIGAANPFRYRGYYYDKETGMYYLNQRYYKPECGRFINADTFMGSRGGLLRHNVFAYCQNNPVVFSDPSGFRRVDYVENGKIVFEREELTRKEKVLVDIWKSTDSKIIRDVINDALAEGEGNGFKNITIINIQEFTLNADQAFQLYNQEDVANGNLEFGVYTIGGAVLGGLAGGVAKSIVGGMFGAVTGGASRISDIIHTPGTPVAGIYADFDLHISGAQYDFWINGRTGPGENNPLVYVYMSK